MANSSTVAGMETVKSDNMIRRLRIAKGLTQRTLARRLDLSKAQVSRVETGTRRPSVEVLNRLLVALDASHRQRSIALAELANSASCTSCES